ncbi:MAG: redoxin domain-containing protein [Verrucomicrobiota bacterium]
MKPSFSRSTLLVLAGLLLAGAIVGLIRLGTPAASSIPPAAAETADAVTGPAWGYDLEGHRVDPLASMDGLAVVLIFVGVECPISNGYAPGIRRLHEEYTSKGVNFWVVYPDAGPSMEAIVKHQTEFQLPSQVLHDPEHSLVARSQASVTPEAAVFLPGGRLIYHGRIDNRHAGFGSSRPEATEHDLRDLLQRIVNGEAISPASTRAVGCYIPRVS